MSACSKPYPPETKTEEIDFTHLYELWSKCVSECFWCYILRVWSEHLSPRWDTHECRWTARMWTSEWSRQLLSTTCRATGALKQPPPWKQTLSNTYGKHFPLYMHTFSAFDRCVILVGDFKMEILGCGNRATETMNQQKDVKKCKAVKETIAVKAA